MISIIIACSMLSTSINADDLIALTNCDRARVGITEVVLNADLQEAAQLKADDMAAKSYFSHNTPEGLRPWVFLDRAGYEYLAAGENLAIGFSDSNQINKAWMDSPSHRANIRNAKYSEVGIATSQGVYEGKQVTFVVEMFGKPLASEVIKEKEAGAEVIAKFSKG